MPNRDGTGPQGQGPGTGRLRRGCAAGSGKTVNQPGRGQGRRNGGGNGPGGSGGRGGRSSNSPNNTQNKQG